ncbi:uncharacterized protein [Nicotiana tomentosiformis]|uniref:uncharacterized protein n=1 Tax=Nicotiana tomentosiformis TaxID=4098 RepID=UPI00388CCCBE
MDCPRFRMSVTKQGNWVMIPVPNAKTYTRPVRGGGQAGRDCLREGGQSYCYTFPVRTEVVASDVVITGIVPVRYRDAIVLFDLNSTYSYVSSYYASYLHMPLDSLDIQVYASTPIGDSIMVNHIYHSYVVTIGGYETRFDLLLFNMMDFDVILCMNWLSPYHAILDCHAKTVTLAMPGSPRLEWKGSLGHIPNRMISFLKAQWMDERGYLVYLEFVRDISFGTSIVDSVPVLRELLDVFLADLPVMSLNRDIDFGIDLAPNS